MHLNNKKTTPKSKIENAAISLSCPKKVISESQINKVDLRVETFLD